MALLHVWLLPHNTWQAARQWQQQTSARPAGGQLDQWLVKQVGQALHLTTQSACSLATVFIRDFSWARDLTAACRCTRANLTDPNAAVVSCKTRRDRSQTALRAPGSRRAIWAAARMGLGTTLRCCSSTAPRPLV
eukprot:363869-Chlamydomonas_euryale.AAC.13